MTEENKIEYIGRYDLLRPLPAPTYTDLENIVASYFELYSKVAQYVSPWNAKQIHSNFPYEMPDKANIKEAIGRVRGIISHNMVASMIESVQTMCVKNKGLKQLITPSITTHHSAQFNDSVFSIKPVHDKIILRDNSNPARRPVKSLHKLEVYGATSPLYIENLALHPKVIKFVIVRPKMGKLGIPNLRSWEALFYDKKFNYIIDHVDSNLNPRWSGIL